MESFFLGSFFFTQGVFYLHTVSFFAHHCMRNLWFDSLDFNKSGDESVHEEIYSQIHGGAHYPTFEEMQDQT